MTTNSNNLPDSQQIDIPEKTRIHSSPEAETSEASRKKLMEIIHAPLDEHTVHGTDDTATKSWM